MRKSSSNFFKGLFVCLAVLSVLSAVAQVDPLLLYRQDYPGEKTILLQSARRVVYDIVDGELKISEDFVYERYHLESGRGPMSDEVSYDSFSRIENLKVYTDLPKKKPGKFKRIYTKTFKERDEFTDGIFHDDVRSISFRYPSNDAGSKTGLSYTRHFGIEQISSKQFFISHIPALEFTFELVRHPAVQAEIKLFNISEDDLEITRRMHKGKEIITYKRKNVAPVQISSDATALSDWSPHVIVYPLSYEVDGRTVPVLRNVGDLFAWYETMIDQIAPCDLNLIPGIVDELLAGVETDEEKIKLIFRYVQDQIKYVAFEDGLGGLIPRNANDVLNKRFGDCKDMSNLMFAMCEHAGVRAYLTWVGTRDIPYTYEELPTPGVDNHMILTAGDPDDLDNFFWLDATSSTVEFGVPTSFIQGKEALVRLAPGEYRVIEVPMMSPEYNAIRERVSIRFEDGKLSGDAELRLGGAYRASAVGDFRSFARKSRDERNYLSAYLQKGNNKFKLNEYQLEIPEVHAGEVVIDHSFQLEDYAFADDKELIINMNISRFFDNDKIKEDRTQPRSFRFKSLIDYTTELELPEGFQIDHLPEGRVFEGDDFSFRFSYAQEDTRIVYRQEITMNTMVLHPDQFADWNIMINELKRAYRDAVVLRRVTN